MTLDNEARSGEISYSHMGKETGTGGRIPRRLALKSLAAGATIWAPGCGAPPPEHAGINIASHAVSSPRPLESAIRIENRLPGDASFVLQKRASGREVEGYASAVSAVAGDTVDLCLSVDRAQRVRWDLYRIGYYQGLGARLVSSGAVQRVTPQPIPVADKRSGLLECDWPIAFSLVIDPTWLTGYYLFKLTNEDGFESYVPLVVRESIPRAPLLVQASVTTWQAYNDWGDISLYVNRLSESVGFRAVRGFKVSFDRPYGPGVDIGFVEHSSVRWLEEQGYDVAYVTNLDVDREPELLQQRKLFLAIGHDEYWSLVERRALQKSRDEGLSLAFLSGNTGYHRIRFEDSAIGVPQRTIVCYKSARLDPHRDAPDTTAEYHVRPYPQPENGLVGVLWAGWAHLEGFALVVSAPDHWLYHGTGVAAGDTLGHIVGYEWDISESNDVSPEGLEIVAESPALHEYGYASTAQATVYYPTPNSFVFGAGTIGWGKGLSEPNTRDARVERVTQNILARAGLFPEQAMIVPPTRVAEPVSSGAARVAAGTGQPGRADGLRHVAQLSNPGGVAALPSGELLVCDSGNNSVRKISMDGGVSTLDLRDQAGKKVRIGSPSGIAVDATGRVFVSDTAHHRILLIDNDGVASNFAGVPYHPGGADDTDPGKARLHMPRGLAFDSGGALYVADFRNDAIRRIDAAGVTTVVAGAGGPTAVAIGADGTLYYVASWAGAIVKVLPNGEQVVLANPKMVLGSRNGPGERAALRPGDGLVWTANGLLFADTANNRVRALAFDAQHTVSTVLGTGRGGQGVGFGSQTELSVPRGLCAFGAGFAVADSANHRIVYFELDPSQSSPG